MDVDHVGRGVEQRHGKWDDAAVLLVLELHACSADRQPTPMRAASRGNLKITSLAEESRPTAPSGDAEH